MDRSVRHNSLPRRSRRPVRTRRVDGRRIIKARPLPRIHGSGCAVVGRRTGTWTQPIPRRLALARLYRCSSVPVAFHSRSPQRFCVGWLLHASATAVHLHRSFFIRVRCSASSLVAFRVRRSASASVGFCTLLPLLFCAVVFARVSRSSRSPPVPAPSAAGQSS